MGSIKSCFFLIVSFSLTFVLSAQATYILFDQSCMERLSFEQNSPDTRRQEYVAYHISLRSGEKLILEVGADGQNEQNYVPQPYLSCSTGRIDKTLATRINNKRSQVFIVYPKNSRTYIISPVAMAAVYSKQGSLVTYESPKYKFRFDIDRGTIGENIAYNNPGVQFYFEGKLENDCAGTYLFRQLTPTSNTPIMDLVLMPEIGIVEESSGANASATMDNTLILKNVNGISKDRYLREVCGMEPGARGAAALTTRPTSNNVPTSYNNTIPNNLNTSGTASLPPGAITSGGQVSAPPGATPVPTATVPVNTNIPNQANTIARTPPPAQPTPITNTTPPATTTSLDTSPTTHTVASGETLYGISQKYNISVKDIKAWNSLKSNMIRRGQVLTVAQSTTVVSPQAAPAVASSVVEFATRNGGTQSNVPASYEATGGRIGQNINSNNMHVVQVGETVASIALSYGYTAQRFREINQLGPNDFIKVGQRLRTSDCDCPDTPTPTVPSSLTNAAPPTSYSNPGGRIAPNNFTTNVPQSRPNVPVVSPGATSQPIRNAGGITPRSNNTSNANVYTTIVPTAYDAPTPSSYETSDVRLTSRSPQSSSTTMSSLESRRPSIINSSNSGFGETEVVPADPRPQSYQFTPASPYPVPASGSSNSRNYSASTPNRTTTTPSRYFTQPTASPDNYSTTTVRTPGSYYTPPSAVPDSYNTTSARTPGNFNQGNNITQRRVHIVRDGETLYGISRLYGLSTEQLRRLNQLGPTSRISPNQKLYIE